MNTLNEITSANAGIDVGEALKLSTDFFRYQLTRIPRLRGLAWAVNRPDTQLSGDWTAIASLYHQAYPHIPPRFESLLVVNPIILTAQ